MAIWPAMYRIDCEICMSVTVMKSYLVIVPALKVKAKPGIPYYPDMLNQPNNYGLPKNRLARKLK